MYIDKLKIVGFKSFARKTSFSFSDRIIGIVGPNGCGKSNVVDAIRWVLGEQKAGTLRSDRMENVIFNGTKNMKPLGMAEVSLTVQNTKNILPVDYSEVVITRRLFRSGESQYLINNTACRLKDINDLFMDTGMAGDAYSVIELGMVESILSGKPDERRRIFEEASGITKYKQRRRITYRKLESTENDLVRVEDIISEVEHKVNSLRRQVRKAQRYQELNEKLRESEIRHATYEYSSYYNELGPLEEQLEEIKRNRESGAAQTSFSEAEVESLKTDLIKIEANLRGKQQELNKANDMIRSREEEILVSRERIKSIETNNERLTREIEDLMNRMNEHQSLLDRSNSLLDEVARKIAGSEKSYEEEKNVLAGIESRLTEKREEAKRAENENLQLLDGISERMGQLESLKATEQHLQVRVKELQQGKESRSHELRSFENALEELKRSEADKTGQISALKEESAELSRELKQVNGTLENTREEIVRNRNQHDAVLHRIGIVEKLLESYSDYPEGVRHLMVEKQGYTGTVADIISMKEAHRAAIETVLGEAATYLLAKDMDQAFIGIESLKESRKGIVTFLPLNGVNRRSGVQRPSDLSGFGDVIGWADELVDCRPEFKTLIQTLIGDSLVVKDMDAIKRNFDQLQQYPINIVTLDGEMVSARGRVKGGKRTHDEAGFVGRRDQLKDLQRELSDLEKKIEDAEKKRSELEQSQTTMRARLGVLEEDIDRVEDELSTVKLGVSENSYKIGESRQFIEKSDQEISKFGDKIKSMGTDIRNITAALDKEREVRRSREDSLSEFTKEVDAIVAERDALSEKVHQFHLDLVQQKGEASNIRNDLERSKSIIVESEKLLENKKKEKLQNASQNEELTNRIEELSSSLTGDYDKKEAMEKVVSGIEEEQLQLREKVDEKEKVLRKLRSEREAISENIHNRELRIAELKLKADNLYRSIGEDFSHDLQREAFEEDYEPGADVEEIERLKQRIKSLGLVNMLALKEYETEKSRFDFLSKQHEDLIEAKKNLTQTVNQINDTARERLVTIFQDIRANFSKVFKLFFANGDADLFFSEEDDPLEADIEIMANPKGKRPASLTLLSGGEKALTAISLLFAIYLVKPSPFCILDEVDAPLDDSNVERFTKTLREFSKETQFIIVTHNKMTMKAADCLYGVTLEDSGVSKVVSVKMD
ncbi:MAG: chromosome segregation protein SMC [candidate division KSB1 bacterium]|jgi:chromosome segregation protein|nr:chromosome segregation protein SMC [candidate division KSB1 bacterium]